MSLRANTEAALRLDATGALLRGAGEHVSLTLQNAQCDRAECAAPGPNAPTCRQSRIWRFSCGFQAGRKLFGHLPARKPWRLKDTRRLLAGASRTCRTSCAVSRRWCHGPDPITRRRVPSAGPVPSRPLALITHSEDDISRFDTGVSGLGWRAVIHG